MSACPSIYELTESSQLSPQLAAHVAGCERCRALRAAWDADPTPGDAVGVDDVGDVVWPHAVYPDVDADPAPGALHSIWGPETGELLVAVVVDVDQREALVVPVSPDVHQAGDWDIVFDEGVLPYAAMAEVWNHVNVLREQLMEQISRLPAALADGVSHAIDAFMDGGELPNDVRQGPALLTERDARQSFRHEEAGRVREFGEPWRLLFAASTLGGVIKGRREDCELEPSSFSQDLELDAAKLSRIEDDYEDLNARIPVGVMARLVGRLSLPPSHRLGELIWHAAFDNVREGLAESEPLRARRRAGFRSAPPQVPEDTRREIADRYTAQVMQRLEEQ
jgi:hypothetical protein